MDFSREHEGPKVGIYSDVGERRSALAWRCDMTGRATGVARLRRDRDVRRVLTEGGHWQDEVLILRALPGAEGAGHGLAVVVGGKFGRAAARNRVKRWVRESTRHILDGQETPNPWWLAIIARPAAVGCDHRHLHASLERLLREAGIVRGECDGATA